MISFVKPSVNGYKADTFYGGLQLAELAGRNCYKSEGKASPGSYKDFLLNVIIKRGHTSILEHCPCYFLFDTYKYENKEYDAEIINIIDSPYSRKVVGSNDVRCYTNLRVVYEKHERFALDMINCNPSHFDELLREYLTEWFTPAIDDEFIRYTMNITTQRSTVDELVRERITSMAVESTRWCDYSEDGKHKMTFCIPHWVKNHIFDKCFQDVIDIYNDYEKDDTSENSNLYRLLNITESLIHHYEDGDNEDKRRAYEYIVLAIRSTIEYNVLRDEYNLKPQDAREFLPLGIKSDIIYTAYYADWKVILLKRLYDALGKAHPNMHIIMQDIQLHLDGLRKKES